VLSPREKNRIKTVVSFAATRIRERWVEGEEFRDDNFFEASPDSRSFFEEVAEGVMIAAQREHEERKLQHIGYMLANLAYEPTIDRATSNWVLRTASELSWTQYLLIAVVGRERKNFPDVDVGAYAPSWESWGIHQELHNLGISQRALLGGPSKKTPNMGLTIFNIKAAEWEFRNGALILDGLLMLSTIPDVELDGLIERMSFRHEDAPVVE
jgi:hypothetical protein